ncbi:MAG: DUF2306 domain-containing protein [Bacteroidota bacterium]
MASTLRLSRWWLPALLLLVLLVSTWLYLRDAGGYVMGDPSELSEVRQRYLGWIVAHFAFAAATLFLGPFQFIPFIRKKYPRFHRISGRVYVVGSVLSALTVYVLLATTYTLPGAIPSLGLLATIWLYTTLGAFRAIRKRKFRVHQEFMLRSYVCGLAFVFIRLLPVLNELTGLFAFIEDDTMRRTVYEWICWVYPLVGLEFWLVWRKQLG